MYVSTVKKLKLINNRTSFLYEKIIDENIQNKTGSMRLAGTEYVVFRCQ